MTARKAENTVSSAVECEIDKLVHEKQRQPSLANGLELNAEGLSSLITRVAGHSTNEIDSLIAELSQVRDFLQTEGERLQQKITEYAQMNQSALESIKIIADAIGPWKSATLEKQVPSEINTSSGLGLPAEKPAVADRNDREGTPSLASAVPPRR